ncbi:MAG: hemolysin III family protein [Tepidisphaeraceae bacterium]
MSSAALKYRRPLTAGEERANLLTHAAAAGLALASLVALVLLAAWTGEAARITSASVFGVALLMLYVASTCYHACPAGPRKTAWRSFDHASIYVLIAGSYTPFMLVLMHGAWCWALLSTVWALAGLGVAWKVMGVNRWPALSVGLYLAMGWIGIVAAGPLFGSMTPGCVAWVFAGGLTYTLGVTFYLWRNLPYHHAIWHLFVLGGSACHVLAVIRYVLPMPA